MKRNIKDLIKQIEQNLRFKRCKKWSNVLSKRNFSLLTSDCIGGVLYHDLKIQFSSPTINLSFDEKSHSFLKFCTDPDFYLSKRLVFIDSNKNWPVAIIQGDNNHEPITINFVHYSSKEECELKWYTRKNRISKNLLAIYLKFDLDFEDIKYLDNIHLPIFVVTNKQNFNDSRIYVSKYLKN